MTQEIDSSHRGQHDAMLLRWYCGDRHDALLLGWYCGDRHDAMLLRWYCGDRHGAMLLWWYCGDRHDAMALQWPPWRNVTEMVLRWPAWCSVTAMVLRLPAWCSVTAMVLLGPTCDVMLLRWPPWRNVTAMVLRWPAWHIKYTNSELPFTWSHVRRAKNLQTRDVNTLNNSNETIMQTQWQVWLNEFAELKQCLIVRATQSSIQILLGSDAFRPWAGDKHSTRVTKFEKRKLTSFRFMWPCIVL
jgi:hypothetical protein